MKIGIDISVLQGPHRMRGVGYNLINFINHLPAEAKKNHTFVLYAYPIQPDNDPLELLELSDVSYELRIIHPIKKSKLRLPGRLRMFVSLLNQLYVLRDLYLGDSRIKKSLHGVEYFMQFEQHQPLPPKRKVKSALVLYDMIQYVMESDYFWGYKTARLKGSSRKGALRHAYHRRKYLVKLKRVTRKAAKLLAISEHTKQDFVKYAGISPKRISVCLLGVEEQKKFKTKDDIELTRYLPSSWGDLPHKTSLANQQFLLFVGGADPRRKLVELVAAFNNLRAQGYDLKLALSGDTMKGAFTIPNEELQEYFKQTSYLDDIYFLGFTSDEQREWLYEHALAFVYPSVYEGFGLPILEAMQYGTPVITYKNSSITEIADNAALFAEDFQGIVDAVKSLSTDKKLRETYAIRGKQQVKKFSWNDSAKSILDTIGA